MAVTFNLLQNPNSIASGGSTDAKEVSGEGFNQFLVERQRVTPQLHLRKWTKTEL